MNSATSIRSLARSVLLLTLIFCGAVSAQEEEAIGNILLTRGSVTAIDANGDSRMLGRRSQIFARETIITGPAGFAQIRLVDSAIVALKENTEFRFDEYNYDGEGGDADRAIMNLVQGGFRTIDGLIGNEDGEEYRVDTQYASIGVRGTTHEAVIDNVLDALFTGVYDGGTTVTNDNGEIELGLGANFDFSRTNRGQAPVGLNQVPQQLGNINFANVADDEEDDADDENDGGDGTDDGDGAADDDGGAADDDGGAAGNDGDDGNDVADADGDAGTENTESGETTTLAAAPANNGSNNGNNGIGDVVTAAVGQRLTELSDDHPFVGRGVVQNNAAQSGTNETGHTGEAVVDEEELSNNAPVRTVAAVRRPANPPGLVDNPNTNINVTITSNLGSTSTNVDVQINPTNNIKQEDIVVNKNEVAKFADSDGDGIPDEEDFYPNDPTRNTFIDSDGDGIDDRDDAFPNDPTRTTFIDSDGDGVDDRDDFFPNDPNCSLATDCAPEEEPQDTDTDTDTGGDDNKGHGNDEDGFDEDNPGNGNGNSNSGGNNGNGNGNSGGNSNSNGGGNSNSNGGGNSSSNLVPSNPDLNVQQCEREPSCQLVDPNLVPSNPDLTVQQCLVDSDCQLVEKSSSGLRQSEGGLVRDLITAVSNLVTEPVGQVAVAEVDGATVLFASIPANAEGGVSSSASVGDLTVDWGYWSLPGLLDGSQEISGADFQRVYLAIVDPANMDDLKSTSGNWRYSSVPNQFTGAGTAGTLTALDVGFDVDLNSGSITSGSFSADVGYGAEQWSMNFTGSVNGATATMGNFTNAVVISPAGITNGIEGGLGGVFTGAGDTNGFVTGFSLGSGASALGGMGLLEGAPQ